MKRWPYIPLALSLVAAVAVVCCPRVPEPPGSDTPLVADALAAPVPEIVPLRLRVKEQLTREVADGRRTLFEAAALFGELNRLPPESAKPTRIVSLVNIPVDTEEGWLCRQVVEGVRVALHREPDRAAAVVA